MRVEELIEILEHFDPDSEVRLATQPGWPFEWTISDVQSVDQNQTEDDDRPPECTGCTAECNHCPHEHDNFTEEIDEEGKVIVYILEGNQIGYLPAAATEQFGWGRNR